VERHVATPDVQQTQTVVAANGQARAALVSNLVVQVQAMLLVFHDWYSDTAVAELADRIAQLVTPTQRVAASQADASLAQLASMSGRLFQPVGPVDVTGLRAGTTTQAAYQRLGEQFRYIRSTGETPVVAMASTTNRAGVMNDTDVALAARAQAQAFMKAHRIEAYRRAIHPERARKSGVCGMCIKAAAHPVPADEPLALHGRCHCTEVPIVGGFDPGHALNEADVADLRSQGLLPDAQPYRITQHGELGPTLTPRSPSTRQA
jgi:hypothetical protein